MTDDTDRSIKAGDTVLTPAHRPARVLSVDQQRGEAEVEILAVRAAFRLGKLTPLERDSPALVFLSAAILVPAAANDEAER